MSSPPFQQSAPRERGFNINTVLLGVVVAISGWTLNRVQNLSEQMAGNNVQVTTQTRDIDNLRARMSVAEAQIQANALAIARLQKP